MLKFQRREPREVSELGLEPWEEIQCKTFLNWANSFIPDKSLQIKDFTADLVDGLSLITLIETLTGESLGRYHKKVKLQPHALENVNLPLKLVNDSIKAKGLKVFYSAEDIMDGNIKMILGLFWVLISRFMIDYISEDEKSAREALLLWCQRRTKGYAGVHVKDLSSSFQDGLALCAIYHSARPAMVDFQSLNPANKYDNLKYAFEVGEKLGIPALVDAEDLRTMGTYMDEKTVMTYLSFVWRFFASDKKADNAADHLKKILAKERASLKLKEGYEMRSEKFISWMKGQSAFFREKALGTTEADVNRVVDDFKEFKDLTKPSKAAERNDLESSFTFINTKLALDNRPKYEPPPELDLDTVTDIWMDLTAAEHNYSETLLAAVGALAQANQHITGLMAQATNFQMWMDESEDTLDKASAAEIASLPAAEAALTQHELYEDAYDKQYAKLQNLFTALEDSLKISKGITPAKHASVKTFLEDLSSEFDQFRSTVHSRSAALNAELLNQRALDAQRLEFAKRAEGFALWIEDTKDALEAPIMCVNVKQVDDEVEALENKSEEISGKWLEIDELATIASDVQADTIQNPYARYTLAQLDEMLQSLLTKADERSEHLEKEKAKQESFEAMRKDFAKQAEAFLAWSADVKRDLAMSESIGTLEEELEAIEKMQATIKEKEAELLAALEEAHTQLADNNLSAHSHTKVTIGECQEDMELLHRILTEKSGAVKDQILAAQDSGIDNATMETSKELFNSFDDNGDGLLQEEELEFCFKAMELEKPVELLAEYDMETGLSFDDFSQVLSKLLKTSDRFEDTRDAFRLICGSKEYVTEQDLAMLSEEDVEFLKENMDIRIDEASGERRKSVSGVPTYDYQTYLRRVYGMMTEEEEQELEAEKEAVRQRLMEEEAQREAQRRAAEEQARQEAEEEERRLEAERKAREEEERKAKEAAEEAARIAAEEAKKAAEEAKRAAEEARKAAEEEERRRAAEEKARQEEVERKRRIQEEALEKERQRQEQIAREKADKLAAMKKQRDAGKSGWLEKKGGTRGGTFSRTNWNERFFQVDGNGIMRYFESEEDASKGKNAKRAIVLKECRAFRIVQYRERNFCLAFELNGGSETFLVSCKTTEEAEAWLEQCNLYLKDL